MPIATHTLEPTLTCSRCRQPSPALAWRERPITGELPADTYQCPHCADTWRRTATPDRFRPVNLIPVPAFL